MTIFNATGRNVSFAVFSAIATPEEVTASDTASQFTAVACDIIFIQNTGDYNARIGDSNVSATRGLQLKPGDMFAVDANNISLFYHIREGANDTTLATLTATE